MVLAAQCLLRCCAGSFHLQEPKCSTASPPRQSSTSTSRRHLLRSRKVDTSDIPPPSTTTSTDAMTTTQPSGAARQADGLIIVGAGIAGLATAAALRSVAGVENVRIVEKLDESSFRDDRAGAGAQLGPNGLRALRAIGGEDLLERALLSGTKLEGNAVVLPAPSGSMVIPDTAEDDTGLPQVLMRWGALRSMLADLVPGECISFGAGGDIMGYRRADDHENSGVSLVGTPTGNDSTGLPSAPLIVAADGIYSTFRPIVRSGGENTVLSDVSERRGDVKYNRRVNIKAAVESELEEEFKPGHTYSFFIPGGGIACFAGPAGDGFTYWAISFVDDGDGDGDGSNAGVVKLALEPESARDAAKLKAAVLDRLRSLEEPLCQFVIDKVEATDPEYIFASPSEEAEGIGANLVSTDGKVVLVGDAAHAMSASYGQAANFALEDAATLAVCLRNSDDLGEAFAAYGAGRIERCGEMQRRSAERAAKAMNGNNAEDVSKWIFRWDVPKLDEGR